VLVPRPRSHRLQQPHKAALCPPPTLTLVHAGQKEILKQIATWYESVSTGTVTSARGGADPKRHDPITMTRSLFRRPAYEPSRPKKKGEFLGSKDPHRSLLQIGKYQNSQNEESLECLLGPIQHL
jgi:hypothetical protein